tara:strand:+ start:424 stop:1455 length:1032 start_codon:yes stop_codon:yes gene_type:complete
MNKEHDIGTKRIDSKSLKILIKTPNTWEKLVDISDEIKNIVFRYSEKNSLHYLIDEKHPEFFKGSIRPDNKISGQRIKILPDGSKLSRAGFSIFAKNLKFNNDTKHEWDVIYENTSGLKTYLYSEEKIHLEQEKKFKIVQKFSENYKKIISILENNLEEIKYLALYTIFKIYIRVGNYDYYLKNSHKGLTTLQKKDIDFDGDEVMFDFIGKDGVPHNIKKKFSEKYIFELKKIMYSKKANDFVFTGSKGNPLHSEDFSSILFQITNEHFYPHIIRSHHADTKCLEYLNGKSKIKDPEKLFLEIAKDLGHKKFNKQKGVWEISPKITISNYIYPGYVEKILSKK